MAMDPSNIDDRRNRAATTNEELHLQILTQIRDTLQQQGKTLYDVKDRVLILEARDERIARLESHIEKLTGITEALVSDKDQRDGASKVFVGVKGWTPVLIALGAAVASIFSAIYLAGRMTGVVAAPPVHVTPQR